MALILNIETATEICSVSLGQNGKTILTKTILDGQKHSEMLAEMIQVVFDESGKNIRQLDAVGISGGPGSYTGLRVGATTAKAICYAQDVPLISVSTLKSLAIPAIEQGDYILSTIDARRMEVYAGVFRKDLHQVLPTNHIIWADDVFEELIASYNRLVICGNGIQKALSSFSIPDQIKVVPTVCNAEYIGMLSEKEYERECFEDLASYSPFYYKKPNITRPKPIF